jgi:hypothetical protein
MKKKLKQDMYKKTQVADAVVVIIGLIAFAALIFVVKYYNDRARMVQEHLTETSSISQEIKTDSSSSSFIDSLSINEINQAGWIEFYNRAKNTSIELLNCYLTVNGIKEYTFTENDVIEEGEFLCIEGLGRLGSTEHDIIGIYDENGELLKNIMYPSLNSEESYGCSTDGGINYCYLSASKGITNEGSSIIKKDELTFSVPGGFYDESFKLEITAAEGMTIYYTLDGTEPTIESDIYTEPIIIENKSGSNMKYATAEGIDYLYSYKPSSISMGMVVRAIAVDKTGIRSEIKTQSYYVGIRNSSDLINLPVLSITTAPENLFDYFEGIYVSGRSYEDSQVKGEVNGTAANYLNDWKKEVNVEYFEPQKNKTYEGKMLISIIKDSTVASPQKSLLLTAQGGAFAGSSLANYYNGFSNRLVVQTNRKDNYFKLREYLADSLLANTRIGIPDIMPCIVFINGEYWGGYMLTAEYDEVYIKKHYDVKEEDVLIARNGYITNKSGYQKEFDELYNFIANNDLRVAENYKWVKDHLDVQNYLEYYCANMYLANAEYGLDDLVMWRSINEQGSGYNDGKWRFLMPRLDNTMKNKEAGKVATSSVNTFLQVGVSNDILFQSLINNQEFKNQLMVVMTEMAEDIFSVERANALFSEISARLKKMVVISYKRFAGSQVDSFYASEVDKIESFFNQRKKYILKYTEEVISRGGNSAIYDDAISE